MPLSKIRRNVLRSEVTPMIRYMCRDQPYEKSGIKKKILAGVAATSFFF